MNNQPSEKHHHHHHEPGTHKRKKRSSKSKSNEQQQPKDIQEPNPTYDSMNTFENQSLPTNQSNDTLPDNSNYDSRRKETNHIFTLSEMKSLAQFPTEEYHDKIIDRLKRQKQKFIEGIRDMIPEYANILESKYNMNFQNGNNRNIGFSFNENFNNNYNYMDSDDMYRNSSNGTKEITKSNSNNDKKTNILNSDGSFQLANDDLYDNPKFSEQNTNDIDNITNDDISKDDILNTNISKNDSNDSKPTVQAEHDSTKKKRRKKVKHEDASNNTANSVENAVTPNLVDLDSKEEGEISENFSIDSLDDNAPKKASNNNGDIPNIFDIEEESVGDTFISEEQIVSNSNRQPLNENSKKISLFNFDDFGKNDDNQSFSDVI